jgi:hypothetical protein
MYKIDRRIAICLRWNYTYIRVPKAANSTVAVNLDYYFPCSGPQKKKIKSPKDAKDSFRELKEIGVKTCKNLMNNHFIFTIVRNPYERVLSAYLDKMRKRRFKNLYRDEIIKYDKNGKVNFKSFCRFLSNGGYKENPHWMPQFWFCKVFGLSNVDFVGKVEKLEEDFTHIVSNIGSRSIFDNLKKPVFESDTRHKTNAKNRKYKFYDSETMEIVKSVYSEDFGKFEYDLDL